MKMNKKTLALGLSLVLLLAVSSVASAQTGVMFVKNNRVSIGTDTPTAPLDINIGSDTPGTGNSVLRLERIGPVGFQLKNTSDAFFWQFSNAGDFRISKSGTGGPEFALDGLGNLTIRGSINTTDCAPCVSDYVFEGDHEYLSLYELEEFVWKNKHLPNVPSQKDVDTAGALNMTEMQMRMLEKIEELVLYTIDQQKEIDALRARLETIEK